FCPGVGAVEVDPALAGSNEVVRLFDGALDDEIVTFFFADFFTERVFDRPVARGQAGLTHRFVKNAAEVDFWIALGGEVFNGCRFAAAGQADKRDDLDVFVVFHSYKYTRRGTLVVWVRMRF